MLMRTHHDRLDSGGLLARIDQLRSSLEVLGGRLRAAVAEVLGETLGGVVRDTVLLLLDRLAGSSSSHAPEPARLAVRSWDERSGQPGWDDYDREGLQRWHGDPHRRPEEPFDQPHESGLWGQTGEPDDEPETQQEPTPARAPPPRLAWSVSAGLQAAALWLRNWAGRRPVLIGVAVAFLAGCLAYTAPALASAAFALAGSLGPLGALTRLLPPALSHPSAFGWA
jgi:hypothetical protein